MRSWPSCHPSHARISGSEDVTATLFRVVNPPAILPGAQRKVLRAASSRPPPAGPRPPPWTPAPWSTTSFGKPSGRSTSRSPEATPPREVTASPGFRGYRPEVHALGHDEEASADAAFSDLRGTCPGNGPRAFLLRFSPSGHPKWVSLRTVTQALWLGCLWACSRPP